MQEDINSILTKCYAIECFTELVIIRLALFLSEQISHAYRNGHASRRQFRIAVTNFG